MKLSWIAKLVGLDPAKATEPEVTTALENTVTLANESKPVVARLKAIMKKADATLAQVVEFANTLAVPGEGGGNGTAVVPHEGMNGEDITKMKADLANCLAAGTAKANELRLAQAEATGLNATIATLTNERDTLAKAKTELETSFVNERAARATLLIENGLAAGKILANEKATWEKDFANSATFDSTLDRYGKLVGKLKVTSQIADGGRRNSTEGERQGKITEFVNEAMAGGLDYTKAFLKVKKEHSDLFAGMVDPSESQRAAMMTPAKK